MIHISSRCGDKLKDELVQQCLDAGIGFRVLATLDAAGHLHCTMKFDRQRQDDMVINLGETKCFMDPETAGRLKDYTMDYLDNPDGGFYLIKKHIEEAASNKP
jgi:Fe-S cluster assembly iron-binding protein IscA